MWDRGCRWSAKCDMGACCKTIIAYEVGCTRRGIVGGCRWSLGHNMGEGVDQGASAAFSGRVVSRKQQGVCVGDQHWDEGGDNH